VGGAVLALYENTMQEIENYNEIDCKVMWELVNYLMENHI
jgi:predicted RecB family nuclease